MGTRFLGMAIVSDIVCFDAVGVAVLYMEGAETRASEIESVGERELVAVAPEIESGARTRFRK